MREFIRQRIEQFERACRERMLPVTTQRRAVLEEILGRTDHPTADQIYDVLKCRLHGLSRTTVYRILDGLVQFGLIRKVAHPGSTARFDPKMDRHHHLVCSHCESIIDFEAAHLNEIPWPDVDAHGFEIRDYHIHFHGLCERCRQTLSAGAAGVSPKVKSTTSAARRSRKQRSSTKQRRNTP